MQQLSWIIRLELVLLSGSLVKGKLCQDYNVGISKPEIIPNKQMTASSFLSLQTRPYQARFDYVDGDGWCADVTLPPEKEHGINKDGEYLQIDLGKEYVFCGIAIQSGSFGYVTSFRLEFSRDGHLFNSLFQTFSGVSNKKEKEFNPLGPFPIGQFVRFIPGNFSRTMCARVELYGFPGPKVNCTPQYFTAEFKRDNYPDIKANEMHLTDTSCKAEIDKEDSNRIVFKIPLRGCGTTVRITSPEYVQYSNKIIRRITQGIISFKMDMTFPVSCKYDRNVTVDGVDYEVKENETTTASSGAVARLQGRFTDNWYLWLVSLWLPGAVVYWVSIADLWTSERIKFC